MKSEMPAFQGLFKIDPAVASQRMLQGCVHDQPVVTYAPAGVGFTPLRSR